MYRLYDTVSSPVYVLVTFFDFVLSLSLSLALCV